MYYRPLLTKLESILITPRHFIQVIAGPRQVGKTTLIQQLLAKKLCFTRSYAADGVIAASTDWLEQIWENTRLEMIAQGEKEGLLVIDEIQKVQNWSEVIKKNWDQDTKNNLQLKVVILGSSRLLIQEGLTESLMGRFELHILTHWSLAEMTQAFNFTPEQYVWFGGYPGAASLIDDETRFKEYVRNSIIEPSINQDILMLSKIDKPALLRQLFEVGSAYSAQILSYNKILGQLQDAGNTTTLSRYTRLLDQAGLLAGLNEYSPRLIKTKLSSPKFQVYNMALLTALQPQSFAEAQTDASWWGRLVESAVGSYLLNQVSEKGNLWRLYYWRKNNLEVDFVIQRGSDVLGIEVKSKAGEPNWESLAVFKKEFSQARVLIVGSDQRGSGEEGGEKGINWREFLQIDLEKWFL